MDNKHLDIDLVYLWVDGSDPQWRKKKELFTNTPSTTPRINSEATTEGRYANNDELKYSLRSAEKHAPWIRNIFIVTDNQKPAWLNTDHPKIKVIDHTALLPPEVLPTFSSRPIEYSLYKIPELSEHFLYANDDMFFNADLSPAFFFAEDGYPIVCLKKKMFGKWHHRLRPYVRETGQYRKLVTEAMDLVESKTGKYISGFPSHNIDSFRKSDYRKAVEEVFKDQVKSSQQHRTRNPEDLQRSVFSYYPLALGHAHLKYVSKKDVLRLPLYQRNFEQQLSRYNPKLFCLNDNERATYEDRQTVGPFLESLFPKKSSYEK